MAVRADGIVIVALGLLAHVKGQDLRLTFCFLVLQRVHAVRPRLRGLWSREGEDVLVRGVDSGMSIALEYSNAHHFGGVVKEIK